MAAILITVMAIWHLKLITAQENQIRQTTGWLTGERKEELKTETQTEAVLQKRIERRRPTITEMISARPLTHYRPTSYVLSA